MKTAIHVAESHWEGRVSQNFDIGLSCQSLKRGASQNLISLNMHIKC